jgi:hypothetical protein
MTLPAARPRARRAVIAVALTSALVLALAGCSGPAPDTVATADPSTHGSSDCDGVVVVVDHGGTDAASARVGCAPGDPASGLDALTEAGHAVTMLAREPRFVCRIDAVPADEACRGFPPADAYWSTWTVEDGRWVYATLGATATDPDPGDVEGWSFGAGTPPRVDAATLSPATGR